ncbi:MAG: DUF3575 domain-containing protein [Chlorobi bacterium]|nr:DUF3575 domain-containing protein [Chlorobiota bacterium]
MVYRTPLHYSIRLEFSIKNKWTTQTTFNFLEIYYDNGDMNRRNALMQEFRFYPSSIESNSFSNFYLLAYPRIFFNKTGNEFSETNPVHKEFEYGGGMGLGSKFFSNKKFHVDLNAGIYYRTTNTDYQKEDREYYGWLPRINLQLCYRTNNINE